jgi:hypothetical protein
VLARIYGAPTELGWFLSLCFYKLAAPLELQLPAQARELEVDQRPDPAAPGTEANEHPKRRF